MASEREELFELLYNDRPLAHSILFEHRHLDSTPDFQTEMQRDWHGPSPYVLDMVFRGGAKSTTAEEAIAIMAGFREFRNAIIVGYSLPKACERLHAIKYEIENNEKFNTVFGYLKGPTWADNEIVLSNGIRILALGRGQSVRGVKYNDARPDLGFIDDLEDRPDVSTPENRKKVFDWFEKDFIPALEPPGRRRIRMAATPLHPEAVPMRLMKDKKWVRHVYPIYYLDQETGEPVSSWPDRWPIETVLEMELSMQMRGAGQAFRQEYMCEAESPETKPFREEHIRVFPRVKSFEPTYSMTDPARTIGDAAATTGQATWSWVGAKLIIWDGFAKRLMPDAIINELFINAETYDPIWQGFEEDGLNQWAMQAIRQEQVKRAWAIPVRAVKAPRGKLDFIRGMQPFFAANEVQFAKEMPDLKAQLLGFPTGAIDAPNALAYCLKMRPGAQMYEDFSAKHIIEDVRPLSAQPVWLCVNASRSLTTGVLVQVVNGVVRVFDDWVREGDARAVLTDILQNARLVAGTRIRVAAGRQHFDRYQNVGLAQAAGRIPVELTGCTAPDSGRDYVRQALRAERQGMPQFAVSADAHWTLRAMLGGYQRSLLQNGMLADEAEDNQYRVLMEGLESFCGLLELGSPDDTGRARHNATTAQGRNYRSMVAGDEVVSETKAGRNALLRGEQ